MQSILFGLLKKSITTLFISVYLIRTKLRLWCDFEFGLSLLISCAKQNNQEIMLTLIIIFSRAASDSSSCDENAKQVDNTGTVKQNDELTDEVSTQKRYKSASKSRDAKGSLSAKQNSQCSSSQRYDSQLSVHYFTFCTYVYNFYISCSFSINLSCKKE